MSIAFILLQNVRLLNDIGKANRDMKVGIIGGGAAGLTAAWLLDPIHTVTLFEKESSLGGHVQTIQVPTANGKVPVDTGFEFFSDAMFPCFKRLLNALHVPIRRYPLTYTFYEAYSRKSFVLPPIHEGSIEWKSLFSYHLTDFLQLKHFVNAASRIVDTVAINITIEEFTEGLMLTSSFKKNFLYPFLAAGWGAPLDDFKTFSAYDILTWYIKNKPAGLTALMWNEIEGGAATYIKAVESELHSAHIKLNCNIKKVQYSENQYFIVEEDDTASAYDCLIIATNAPQACKLLNGMQEMQHLCKILDKITYFPTLIAVHGDRRFLPYNEDKWSVINVRSENTCSTLTVYKKRNNGEPIFRSWVTYDTHLCLEPLYGLYPYEHLRVTPEYFYAQQALELTQGTHNLWLAGLYTYGIDSHESAICSAIRIAQTLAPASFRLKQLMP